MRPSEEMSRRSASPSVVLPEPDSPTTPSVCPSRTATIDAVDRLDVADGAAEEAAADREPDLDVVAAHDDRRVGLALRRAALRLGGEQVSCVGVLRLGEHLFGRPRSTISPLVMTQTRSAIFRTMPRSWVMNSIARPVSAFSWARSSQDLRLHGDVERRRRLVGDQQVRLVGERHGDHDALALAAGELVRIGAEPLLRLADADLVEELQHARRAPPRRSCRDARRESRRPAAPPCAAG